MRAAALTVVPRVINVLRGASAVETRCPAPEVIAERLEEPPVAVTSPPKVQKTTSQRWVLSAFIEVQSPLLSAWFGPVESRGPPSHFGGKGFSAYLHPRSFPINGVDPSGLEYNSRRPLESTENSQLSDALGLLSGLSQSLGASQYRAAAVSISNLDRQGYIRINNSRVTDLAETRRGLQFSDHGINLSSALFHSSPFERLCAYPQERFNIAVLAAGVLFHENWHWNNFSSYDTREPEAWQQELGFYRDLLLAELGRGADQARLDSVWRIGADRLAAGRLAGHVPASASFFDFRNEVLGSQR